MVKLKGPGLATSAAGGLGKTICFSQSKGRAYLKRWHKPRNPQTTNQQATRAILAFLSSNWANLSDADQATWETLATNDKVSPFNAFTTFNLQAWAHHLAPSKTYPATRTGPWGVSTSPVVTAVSRGVTFVATHAPIAEGWTILLYNVPTFGTPKTHDTLIKVVPIYAPGAWSFTWRPVAPGTYHFAISGSTNSGNLVGSQYDRTAVVT